MHISYCITVIYIYIYIYTSHDGWLGYSNFLFKTTSLFNPRNIYFVAYVFGYFFDRNASYVVTNKTCYFRNDQKGNKS